jgi:UPF0755 protein
MRRKRKTLSLLLVGLVVGVFAGYQWFMGSIAPVPAGVPRLVRYDTSKGLASVLRDLESKSIIRNANTLAWYARFRRGPSIVGEGTYRVAPGMSARQVLDALRNPLRFMVRIPETNFSFRTARLLEKNEVTTEVDYNAAVANPENYASLAEFPLPKNSLEGYLYPDTYDLPPQSGADAVIRKQLRNFQKRVWNGLEKPANLHRVLTIASMVELEVMKDNERAIVAGVIENRLYRKMRLQIDATVNYALKEWRALTLKDLKDTDSPYNTYRYAGLPPGPICSPTVKSIQAAMNPARHAYLYYVALPDGSHLFAKSFEEHRRNIAKRRAALGAQ